MKWYVSTKKIDEIVEAVDQWAAFDSLREREPEDFGLIVEAQPTNETVEQEIGIRTSMLFGRWGRPDIAQLFIQSAIRAGLPDTTAEDIP